MKMFSLATLTGALIFTSSLAVAGPRPGPAFDIRHDQMQMRGGFVRPGLVMRGPMARVAPHCGMPPFGAVFAPQMQFASPLYNAVPHQHMSHFEPAPAPAPVVSTPQAPVSPQSGGGKPSRPNGQGNGGTKPQKPAR